MKYAAAQHVGKRELQEDFCGLRHGDTLTLMQGSVPVEGEVKDALCCVLADGMGGHEAGEIASRLVGEGFLVSTVCSGTPENAAAFLPRCASSLNSQLRAFVEQNPDCDGMGTTLVGARIDKQVLRWVSVGDSHLYLLRGSGLHKLNDDHSMKPAIDAMVEQGIISQDEADDHPDRNALRSAIMGHELSLVDFEANGVKLQRGDIVLLASDGLDTLSDAVVTKLMRRWKMLHPKWLVSALLRSVKAAKSTVQDNVSVIAISV